MYVRCTYGSGSHPVKKWDIQITFGLGSDRFSPKYTKSTETHYSLKEIQKQNNLRSLHYSTYIKFIVL